MKKKIDTFVIVFIMLIVSFTVNVFQHVKILEIESNMDTLRGRYIELYEEVK